MKAELVQLLKELEKFGDENDQKTLDRHQRMLNITPDTGPFLSVMLQACKAKQVLEIGTSNGYSTLWLAQALTDKDGRIVTIEVQDHKVAKAHENFQRSGLFQKIQQVQGDAGEYLQQSPADQFDLIFLDSDRAQYAGWWTHLIRVLKPGGLLIVDNAVSHAHELTELTDVIQRSGYPHTLVPIGKGELIVVKPAIIS